MLVHRAEGCVSPLISAKPRSSWSSEQNDGQRLKEVLKIRFSAQIWRESTGSVPLLVTIYRDKEEILSHKPGSKAAFFSWESCYFLQHINFHVKYLVARSRSIKAQGYPARDVTRHGSTPAGQRQNSFSATLGLIFR